MHSYDESRYDWRDEYERDCELLGYDPEEEFEDEDEWEDAREEYRERTAGYRIIRALRR